MSKQDELSKFNPQATYGKAAPDYEVASRLYWSFASERTVDRLALNKGAKVLDVACGPGWSAMRAAERVGPEGHVIAIDYAEPMIVRACAQAQERGFQNIEFRLADMTKLGFPDDHFDAVVCVLGVFFVDDMVRQISEFWRMVRPGGQLAITNIGPKFFLPMFEVWKETIQKERPDLTLKYPWERANDPEVVFEILSLAGLLDAEVLLEHKSLPLRSAEDWWNIVMGTGLRRTVEEIGPEAADRVRKHNLKWIKENNTLSLELSIIYAIATKP